MRNIPQNLFAMIVLVVALVVIIAVRRPHSVCDSQTEVFKVNQTPFLYLDQKKTQSKTTTFARHMEFCKRSNSSGGCLEFFDGMKTLYLDLAKVPSGCTATLTELPEVRSAIFVGLELMVRLAWGERPPLSNLERNSWLDTSQVSIFCNYKKLVNEVLGSEAWAGFVEKQISELPGASVLPRDDVWGRTLMSEPCIAY